MGNGLAFRISGIPVRIDPTFLLIVVLLGFGVRSGALLVSWVVIVTDSGGRQATDARVPGRPVPLYRPARPAESPRPA